MTIIKHVKNLPRWFDLTKYASVNELDTLGWLEQLTIRRNLIFWMMERVDGDIEELFELVKETPILDTSKNFKAQILLRSGALDSILNGDNFSKYALGVHLLTVREFYQMQMNFDDKKRDYAVKFFKQFNFKNIPKSGIKYKCVDWIDQPVDAITTSFKPKLTFNINLNLPDKILLEQFESLIKDIRGNLQKVGVELENKQKFDANSFTKFAVLPYLDLIVWYSHQGFNIPNRVMADSIFSVGEGGEEVVRKTIKRLVESILKEDFLEKLQAIAAQEKAEQKKG